MIVDGDYMWAVCPLCGKLNWCFYMIDIHSELMAVYLCCDECEEKKIKSKRKLS